MYKRQAQHRVQGGGGPHIPQIAVLHITDHTEVPEKFEGDLVGQGAVVAQSVVPGVHAVVGVAGGGVFHPVESAVVLRVEQRGQLGVTRGVIGIVPVSYTDLVVYKRQGLRHGSVLLLCDGVCLRR